MGVPAINSIYELQIISYMSALSQLSINVRQFQITGIAGAIGDENFLAAAWASVLKAAFTPIMTSTSLFQGVEMYSITQDDVDEPMTSINVTSSGAFTILSPNNTLAEVGDRVAVNGTGVKHLDGLYTVRTASAAAPFTLTGFTSPTRHGLSATTGTVRTFTESGPIFIAQNSGNGARNAGNLPTQSAGLVSLYTNGRGRRNHGRMYIPFPDMANNDPVKNVPNALYLTGLTTIGNLFSGPALTIVDTNSATYTYNSVLFNPYKSLVNNMKAITSNIPRAKWATQRRRGAYGRTNTNPLA